MRAKNDPRFMYLPLWRITLNAFGRGIFLSALLVDREANKIIKELREWN